MRRWKKRAEYHEECAMILKEAVVKLQELYAKEEEEGDHINIQICLLTVCEDPSILLHTLSKQ
jgi:hypothetical protein